jgi:hypothetical protein
MVVRGSLEVQIYLCIFSLRRLFIVFYAAQFLTYVRQNHITLPPQFIYAY